MTLEEKLQNLPDAPGIYIMKDHAGQIIYIGKTLSFKSLLTGGMYVPLELFEIVRGVMWPRVTLLIVNAGIAGYLSFIVFQTRQKRKHAIQ